MRGEKRETELCTGTKMLCHVASQSVCCLRMDTDELQKDVFTST